MTELLSASSAPSDAELIARVRGGDLAAYGELFERHVEAARRLARQLMRGPDVDDLVSEAFARTLIALQGGGGPDVAFRAYLLTSVRRIHVDRIRSTRRVQPAEDMTAFDAGVAFHDPAVADFDNSAAARAFRSLPERWQLVLWHLEVEGQKPADVAPLLGMSPNSVSALAYRAREGLRQAFLTMHATDETPPECRWVTEHLGGYVRNGLSRRDSTKVDAHLQGCRRCTAVYLELTEVNSHLAAIIGPLVLGAVASAYVAAAGGSGVLGVSALLGRVRDTFGTHSGGAAAGGSGAATGGGALGGGGGLLAGGTLTGSGALAIGGIAAAAVAVTTTAALVLGGGTPASSPAAAASEAPTSAHERGPALPAEAGTRKQRGSPVEGARPASTASETVGSDDAVEGSASARSSTGAVAPEDGSPGEPATAAHRVAERERRADAPGGTQNRTSTSRRTGTKAEGAGKAERPGRDAGSPTKTKSPWPAVQQPTDTPGPPPYGSKDPVKPTPVPPTPGGGGGQDGGASTQPPSGGSKPGAGSTGRGKRGNAGPGKGNDNGHHKGHEQGRGHLEGHGKGHGKGHGHSQHQ